MEIAILSSNANLYSTSRIVEAARSRGHKVKVMDPLRFSMFVESNNPSLTYNNKTVKKFDAVIPRIGASITFFGTALVRQFEQMGSFVLNTANAISASRDKLRCFQILSTHRIGLPKTAFVRQKAAVLPAIEAVGGSPVIIKLLEGTQGIGVILADSTKIAEAIIETLQSTRQNVLIQSFVKESKGRDVRAFVVGDRVVAAMRRVAKGDEFRSNVHRGGEAQKLEIPPEYERAAIMAAQILGLRVAGVDMLEGAKGPQIMEVNSSPGLEGIEGATGVDVAGEIIGYIEDQVLNPEIDLRNRLMLDKDYGIAEVPIGPESWLLGKTVKDSGLRAMDVLVLSIQRGGNVISNPRPTRTIENGDRLLCYGKVMVLKSLVPQKRRGRDSKRVKLAKV
ncbi:MAG: 30S ribosomal protein S6--L-glutamate ligase [Planctomycetes bacterium]|nr:30S ribosomal protein S6--L-glutamate ligase [Planctomycetota bacterium]